MNPANHTKALNASDSGTRISRTMDQAEPGCDACQADFLWVLRGAGNPEGGIAADASDEILNRV
jgi:hypothetical protein